jgi:hypothetical protein
MLTFFWTCVTFFTASVDVNLHTWLECISQCTCTLAQSSCVGVAQGGGGVLSSVANLLQDFQSCKVCIGKVVIFNQFFGMSFEQMSC